MFTGIVEEVGIVEDVHDHGTNRDLIVRAAFASELAVDQSVSHNGACLTVVEVMGGRYRTTAVQETLRRSNLGLLRSGDGVNLERSLRLGDRMDGHMVQGHVDAMVKCEGIEDRGGSWWARFQLPQEKLLLVPKGSITLNGVSLTIAELNDLSFAVAIIPYTFEHTTFRSLKKGDQLNVESDVVGKYVERILSDRPTL